MTTFLLTLKIFLVFKDFKYSSPRSLNSVHINEEYRLGIWQRSVWWKFTDVSEERTFETLVKFYYTD